ncbi:MAG: hypothetical protein LC687_06580 [Actinobacteria bacterium]|nr:hypothetical protein [Actinomycetota bacterium]MCA1807494.1 hypothetical protein [Actinomycetota bacterium]
MRNRNRFDNFDRHFNRTSMFIKIMFGFVILMKILIISLIIYCVYWLITSDVTFNNIGTAIGSFIGSIEQGMDSK